MSSNQTPTNPQTKPDEQKSPNSNPAGQPAEKNPDAGNSKQS